jgi:hypothetical protein
MIKVRVSPMWRSVGFSLFYVSVAIAALAATQPIYINNSPVHVITPPQMAPTIDATAFVNRSEFEVNDIYFSGLPYQTFNTLFFTNASSGIMSGNVGLRFDFVNGPTRRPMDSWINQGTISVGTFLLVNSTNITSTGPVGVNQQGLLRLTGKNINLTRNGVRAGGAFATFGTTSGFNNTETNYIDPTGVTDIYWGLGTNNVLSGNGNPVSLPGTFTIPSPSVPQHRVNYALAQNQIATLSSFQSFAAFAYTNQISSTSRVVQVIFVPTNNIFDTNISTRAFFVSGYPGSDTDNGLTAVVELSYREYDVVNQDFINNYLYFVDSTAFATNLTLARNLVTSNTRRPNSYELIRHTSATAVTNFSRVAFGAFGATEIQPNTSFTNTLLYNTSYASNNVPVAYAAYAAQFDGITVLNGSGQNIAATVDPTNYPGRVEIVGDNVNLDLTRIRAESTVIIKANELVNSKVATISAPFENLDLRTSQPEMVISNFAPNTVQRLTGQLGAYSATWRNFEPSTTNTIDFHVLVLSPNLISTQPITINELALHAPRIVIGDPLNVRKSMLLDTRNLEITGGLTLPAGANWANSNIFEVYTFTNRGIINVPTGSALVGTDRDNPYDYYVNFGTNSAASHDIRTRHFYNPGCLIGNSGVIAIEADTALIAAPMLGTNVSFVITNINGFFQFQLVTNVVRAKVQGNADVHITADQITLSNAVVQTGPAGGSLFLSPGTELSDGGATALSYINVSGGFNLQTRPATSSLLGTYVTTTTPRNSESFHSWSGTDLGPTANGYTNNSALGKLTIDLGQFSIAHFSAPPGMTGRAIYVDYLELLNYGFSNYNAQIDIDPSLTIYFANANLNPLHFDGAVNGRFRWVANFAGPLSSTNLLYPDGQVHSINVAVATDLDLDSDRDGILNAEDPTPIYVASSIGLEAFPDATQQGRVVIQWNAFPGVVNTVQYCNSIVNPNWVELTSVVPPGPYAEPFSITDTPTGDQRIYRVLVNVPPF